MNREFNRHSYRLAAAVLDSFTFPALNPADPSAAVDDPRPLLFDDVVPVAGAEADQRFALSLSLRQDALRELGTREAMKEVLDRNPGRPRTDLQLLWEDYLDDGALPDLASLGFQELTRVCQVLSWLDRLDPNLPSLELAEKRLRRQSVYRSFEHLVSRDFTGRGRELKMLRDHIGALPPAKGLSAALNQLRDWSGLTPKPILMLYGVGGIGKSALIGRLLWEQAEVDDDARFPFAYLAFDQPWLRVDAPHTMLAEAATQLEIQYPQHVSAFAAFRDAVLSFRDSRGALYSGRAPIATRAPQGAVSGDLDEELFMEFADLLRAIGARRVDSETVHAPVVLVFDTFEEVQYRDREVLNRFWRMLDRIQGNYTQLRAIVCGRAAASSLPAKAPKMREEMLAELESADRVSLLMRLGVRDPQLAAVVAEQVGGNPLTLRLAADVVQKEETAVGTRGIDNLVTRRLLFFQLDERLVQGQLYQRVLNHIHDPRVRQLAHPGMVLRRVDPDVILHVLAPVCMPELRSPVEASEIFEALRRENTLVSADTRDNALVYRPDIRSALLRLLQRDRFDEVRRLRRAAIAYYQTMDGDIARGEEMFHRLALGEDEPWRLEQRWDEAARSALASSLEEFSDPMKAWLASRMSLEVPRSVFASADLEQWERNTTRKVQLAIADNQPELARALLAERSNRSLTSPLFALEAKILLSRPSWMSQADAVIDRGIESLAASSNRGRLAEMFWLRSQLKLSQPLPDAREADASLLRAQRAVERSSSPIPLMHILGQRLLLRQSVKLGDRAAREALEHELAALAEGLSSEQVHAAGIAALLASTLLDPRLYPTAHRKLEPALSPTSRRVTLDLLTDDLQGLDEYREPWELDILDASRVAPA